MKQATEEYPGRGSVHRLWIGQLFILAVAAIGDNLTGDERGLYR